MERYNICIYKNSIFNKPFKTTGLKTLPELKELFKDVLDLGRVKNGVEIRELDEIKTINTLLDNLSKADSNTSKGYHVFYVLRN